jgi:N-acetylmuramoyl-L-alanine amidase
MGLHKDEANLNVAMTENAAILLEENQGDQYEGFDVNSPESYIKFTLIQDTYRDQSNELAYLIQEQFKDRVGRKDRGVYQAGFLVLWRTAMPGVLVELGFISNPTEEKFLLSEEGQSLMASAIYRAFKTYKTNFETENSDTAIIETPQPKNILEYRVQFYTSPTELAANDRHFKGISELDSYYQNGLFKYTSGHFQKLNDATNRQNLIRKNGFEDAFVVAFYNNERITIQEAAEIEKNVK